MNFLLLAQEILDIILKNSNQMNMVSVICHKVTLVILFITISLFSYSQNVKIMAPESIDEKDDTFELKENCYFLRITIDKFDKTDNLKCTENLKRLDFTEKHILNKSYESVESDQLSGYVTAREVIDKFDALNESVGEESMVIIVLASHGYVNNGDYYFVTSDSDIEVTNSMVSGDFLIKSINEMGTKGARVLLFIDTCHAEGMFADKPIDKNVFCIASSKKDQNALQIESKSIFSDKLEDLLTSHDDYLKDGKEGYVWISSIFKLLTERVNTHQKEWSQTSVHNNTDDLRRDAPVFKYVDYSRRFPVTGKAFLPWSIPNERYLPYSLPKEDKRKETCCKAMVGLEAASLISFVTCWGFNTSAKCKIQKAQYDTPDLDKYRKRGKMSSVGCICSVAAFAVSYACRFGIVNCEYRQQFRNGDQSDVKVAVHATAAEDYVGMGLTFNF